MPAPSELQVTNYSENTLTVRWEPAADDVTSYLIKWISLSGGDLRQVSGSCHHCVPVFVSDRMSFV